MSWKDEGYDEFMIKEPSIESVSLGTSAIIEGTGTPMKEMTQDSSVAPAVISSGGIKGQIQVVSGYIESPNFVTGSAGWNLDSGGSIEMNSGTFRANLAVGSGNAICKIDSNGLYLGHATFASAPFRIDMAGNVTGTTATFSQYFHKTNDDADDITESVTKRWAGETGADITSAHTAAAIVSQGALATLSAVAAAQIATNAVTEAKINASAVTTDKIAADAVTATKINVVGLNGTTGRIIVADATDANVVTDGVNTYASTLITAGKILISGTTALSDWSHATDVTKIDGGDIYTGSVTATQITVANLSALSADIGTVTAGTITGLTIQSSASANTGVKMSSGGLDVYGQTCDFYDTSGNFSGRVYGSGANSLIINSSITAINGQLVAIGVCRPNSDNGSDLGTSSIEWKDLFIDGTAQVDALRIDQTPTAETPAATHTITISANGTNYKLLCLAA